MFITVDTQIGRVSLGEPHDFQAFHVVAIPIDATEETVGTSLGNDGAPAGDDHVWVTVEAVHRLVGNEVTSDWVQSFQGMLGYAASKGWMSEDGACIKAHISRD